MSKIKIKKNYIQKLIVEALGHVLSEQGALAAKKKAWQEARKKMIDAAKKLNKSWKDIKSSEDGPEAWKARLAARAAYKELQKAKGTATSKTRTTEPAVKAPKEQPQGLQNLSDKAAEQLLLVPWCKKSNLNRVEELICKTPELAKLEAKNVKLYRDLYGNKINDGLRNFIKKRNSCTDVACIKSIYEKRIQELSPSKSPSDNKVSEPATQVTAKRPSWAVKLNSKNSARSNQCPPIWVPYRRRVEVFLEKAEKEELVLFDKYPNREPANWREEIRRNMRIRESGLTGWVGRYTKVKSKGKLELKPERITAMIRNSGAIDKEGLKRMQLNLQKMIDCEIEYINSPAHKNKKQDKLKQSEPTFDVSPTPGAGGRSADPTPQGPPDFEKAIYSSQAGDRLSLTFLKTVKDRGFTVFKPGPTYTGKILPKKVNVRHESILFYGSDTTMTKKEFIDKVKKKGDPCTIVDCQRSTITRGGKQKSFIEYLQNPNF